MTSGTPDERTPDEQLAAAIQARREAEGLDERLEAARERAAESAEAARRAAAQLTEEERDVARLESLSWSRILSALRSSHTTDLDRETAERDAARYAAGTAEARAAADLRELESIREQRKALGDVNTAYDAALVAKEQWLSTHDATVGPRLVEIAGERGQLGAEEAEAREAFEAGVAAHQHLAQAESTLGSAQSWSTWDTFGGGELFTDMVKYDKLDTVGRELEQADVALRHFTSELADVHLPAVKVLEIDRLTETFDVWFDNIFSDWAMRDRIIDARSKVQLAVDQVRGTLDQLAGRRTEIAGRLAELSAERGRLLGG